MLAEDPVLSVDAVLAQRHWTVDDAADLPDDRLRYECLDGRLVVSPPPMPRHQLVVSPGSRRTDRVVKPAEYAAAGIAHYWRVETEPLELVAHSLEGDRYVVGPPLAPFPVTVDVPALGA